MTIVWETGDWVRYSRSPHGPNGEVTGQLIDTSGPGDPVVIVVPAITPNQVFTLNENVTPGFAFGTISVSNNDPEDPLVEWTIKSKNPTSAKIGVTSSGQLVTTGPIDFETMTEATIVVSARNSLHQMLPTQILISVNNIDENPYIHLNQIFIVQEGSAPGTVVGTVMGTDPENNTLQDWAIVGGTGAALFSIHPTTGVVTVANSAQIDYETATSYTLTVTATDGVHSTGPVDVTINVSDVAEKPIITSGQTFSIPESVTGVATLGTIAGTDPEGGQLHNWTILGGTGAALFEVVTATGQLRTRSDATFDYEAVTSYTLMVQVQNTEGTSSNSTLVTVNVTNVNETPVIQEGLTFSVVENASAGTIVGTAAATDPDGNGLNSWTIVGGSSLFVINSSTGLITVKEGADIDYESATSHNISLTVRSAANVVSAQRNVVINVTDVVEGVSCAYATPGNLGNSQQETLVLDNQFSNQGSWLGYRANLSIVSGRLRITNNQANYGSAYLNITLEPNTSYRLVWDAVQGTGGTPSVHVGTTTVWNKYGQSVTDKDYDFTTDTDVAVSFSLNVESQGNGQYNDYDFFTLYKRETVSGNQSLVLRTVSHTASVTVPALFSGMTYRSHNSAGAGPVALPNAGFSFVRTLGVKVAGGDPAGIEPFAWRNIETNPGAANLLDRFDFTKVNAYIAALPSHVKILWTVFMTPTIYQKYPYSSGNQNHYFAWPSWAGSGSPPADNYMSRLGDFIQAILLQSWADRVFAFEVWNEPLQNWNTPNTVYDASARITPEFAQTMGITVFYTGSATDYANMVWQVHNRAAGREVLVGALATPNDRDNVLVRFLNAPVTVGGSGTMKDFATGVSTHFYDFDNDVIDLEAGIASLKQVTNKPLWHTEGGGWSNATPSNILAMAQVCAANGLKSFVPYFWGTDSEMTNYMGANTSSTELVQVLADIHSLAGKTICNAGRTNGGYYWTHTNDGTELYGLL